MSDAACKAAICDDEAEGRMMTACEKINSLKKGLTTEYRIKHSEIYIHYIKKAQAKADALIMESGQ